MIAEKDLKILSHLRQNARMSLTRMSKKTKIPVSTIFDRLKLQEDSYISKHVSLIDFSKLGYNTRVNMTLKVKKEQRDDVRSYLMNHQNVNSVYKINNGFDFMVEGVFRHLKDFEDFIEKFEEKFDIIQQQTFYIIDDIKKEAFMSNPELVALVQ